MAARRTVSRRKPSSAKRQTRARARQKPAARSAARLLVPASEVAAVLDRLETQHPNAFTELNFRNPYELLVATILSAQCTDARVNQTTPALFARYLNAA